MPPRLPRNTASAQSRGQLPVLRNKWHVLIFKLQCGLSPCWHVGSGAAVQAAIFTVVGVFTGAGFAAGRQHFIVNGSGDDRR